MLIFLSDLVLIVGLGERIRPVAHQGSAFLLPCHLLLFLNLFHHLILNCLFVANLLQLLILFHQELVWHLFGRFLDVLLYQVLHLGLVEAAIELIVFVAVIEQVLEVVLQNRVFVIVDIGGTEVIHKLISILTIVVVDGVFLLVWRVD